MLQEKLENYFLSVVFLTTIEFINKLWYKSELKLHIAEHNFTLKKQVAEEYM